MICSRTTHGQVPELREITVNTKLLSEVTQFDNFYIRRQPVLDYRQSLQL